MRAAFNESYNRRVSINVALARMDQCTKHIVQSHVHTAQIFRKPPRPQFRVMLSGHA